MCMISINHHPSCKCTYYILEQDCGASSTSHPSCVQFISYPVSRWSNKTSYIKKISGDCGSCSGTGDSSDVLARINILKSRPGTADAGGSDSRAGSSLARWRPDTGLSVHTDASMDSVSSQASVNSNFRMDGLSRSVSMGIQTSSARRGQDMTAAGNRHTGSKSSRKAAGTSPFQDRFTRPEMEWRRTELAGLDHTEEVSCWIL